MEPEIGSPYVTADVNRAVCLSSPSDLLESVEEYL